MNTLSERFRLPPVEDELVIALLEEATGQFFSSWDGSALSLLDYAETNDELPDHAVLSEHNEFMEAEDVVNLIEAQVSSSYYFMQGLQKRGLLPIRLPIENAPKTGERVLLWSVDGVEYARWNNRCWTGSIGGDYIDGFPLFYSIVPQESEL